MQICERQTLVFPFAGQALVAVQHSDTGARTPTTSQRSSRAPIAADPLTSVSVLAGVGMTNQACSQDHVLIDVRMPTASIFMDDRTNKTVTIMTERRVIFIGKKPLHSYVRAVVMAMEEGDRSIQLVARGATIGRAVDVAEVCRRRSGHIAQGLPETVTIEHLACESESLENDDGSVRTVSVLRIDLHGEGEPVESN